MQYKVFRFSSLLRELKDFHRVSRGDKSYLTTSMPLGHECNETNANKLAIQVTRTRECSSPQNPVDCTVLLLYWINSFLTDYKSVALPIELHRQYVDNMVEDDGLEPPTLCL